MALPPNTSAEFVEAYRNAFSKLVKNKQSSQRPRGRLEKTSLHQFWSAESYERRAEKADQEQIYRPRLLASAVAAPNLPLAAHIRKPRFLIYQKSGATYDTGSIAF